MRWSYLIPRVVIVVIAWAFFAFLFDPLLRMGLVTAGQSATAAKVDVNSVQTVLYPPEMTINNVQVANQKKPGINLFQFDQFKFRMRGDALLHRRFIIEEGSITGLRFGTDRGDSGLLDGVPIDETNDAENGFGAYADQAKQLGKEWLNDVLARTKLQTSLDQFESIRLAKLKEKEWKVRLADYQQRVKNLELKIKQIEQSTKKPKGNFLEKMEHYRVASLDVQKVLDESNKIRAEFPLLSQIAQKDFDELEAARLRDQEKIKQKVNLFKIDSKELTDILLGPELANRLEQATEWFQWGKEKQAGMKQPQAERGRGIDVFFPLKDDPPQFLIKKLLLSGEMQMGGELLPFRGVVQGITTDSQKYGKPIVVDLDANGKSHFRLHSEIDNRTKTPIHKIQLVYVVPQLEETQLGDAKKFGLAISAGHTEWTANITLTGDQLSGHVTMVQSPVAVIAKTDAQMSKQISEMMEEAVSGIENIEATLNLGGTLQKPKWDLKSNLGDQISKGISTAMTATLEKQKQMLTQKLNTEFQKKTGSLNQMMAKEFAGITSGLNLNDQFAQKQIQKLTSQNPNLREAKRKLNFKSLFR